MIDRGYLGVEIDVQQVALRQKAIIRMCNLVGKPVLVANHVLETLCDHPRPTRSEASNITSVIMDGVDALVLSAVLNSRASFVVNVKDINQL
jgi:pyruvate kinase